MKINYARVYGLRGSIRAAKFPVSVDTESLTSEITDGIKKLAQCEPGTGHDNWLNGVIVQFDLTCTNKMWVEMERYHFVDFVSSQSTMHKAAHMELEKCFCDYVTPATRAECLSLQREYNENPCAETYLKLLYNLPSGLELSARMTTNYRQLKTIYLQRLNHRLPEWKEFCRWIETLPMSELITGKEDE